MVLYGSRMYGRGNKVRGWGICEHCGRYAENTSYDGKKWGHIYYIPLIPLGKKVRVIKECKKCSHGIHLPIDSVPKVLDSIQKITGKAVLALLKGENDFTHNGKQIEATPYLADSVEMLHCLEADAHLDNIITTLKEKGLNHPYLLIQGKSLEFMGNLPEAERHYTRAIQRKPRDVTSFLASGLVYIKMGEFQKAKTVYEKGLVFAEKKLPFYRNLLTVYEGLKEHSKLAATYEKCLELVPGLKNERKFMRGYKKACRKAGKKQ